MYAAAPIAAGTEVLVADPFATVVVDAWHREVCAACFTFDCRRRCKVRCERGCRVTAYCSTACQDAHRDAHALECALLRRLASPPAAKLVTTDLNHPHYRTRLRLLVALFARVMVLQHAGGGGVRGGGDGGGGEGGAPPWVTTLTPEVESALAVTAAVTAPSPSLADLAALASNFDVYTHDEALMALFVSTYDILRAVVPEAVLSGGASGGSSGGGVYEYVQLLCREECNSFGFWDEGDEMYAYGLFPLAAFFNHSCHPTVCKFTVGRRVHFRAMRDLAPGEELTISYVLLNDSTEMRRQILRASYLFTCVCARCSAAPGTPDDYLAAYVHHCGGPIYPDPATATRVCSKCKQLCT